MLNLARSHRMVARFPSYFDSYDHLINTERGVQDLRTGLCYAHHPGYSQSKLVRIRPNRSGCPIWTRFLERVLQEDDDLIRFVQRAMGYSLTGETREQVLFLLYGTGRNGKSTFLNVLHALAGEYAQHAEFSTFLERQTEMVRNDLARLHKSRLVTAVEPTSTGYLDESVIKQVTGQDVVTARFLFQEHFEYVPRFKIWLAANHKPMIRGNDEGIWRRILMVPFTVTIPEDEKDPDLPRKLVAELPAIFSWAADGARIWYEEGLQPPKAVREATQAYRDDMDSIGMFLHVKCVTLPNVRSMATALYRHYVRWTETGGEKPLSQKKFGMRLEERGIDKKRTAKGYEYHGIAIAEDGPHDVPPLPLHTDD
jgi:putative DNA primase/helicase